MPVSPALAENLAAEVVGHYQEAERTLLARIARNLAKGIDGPHWAEDKYAQLLAYQRQTEALIADLRAKAKTGVDTAVTSAYERGGLSAVADMNAMGVTAVEHLAGLRAVEAMAAETLGYVNATHPRILRSTMDAYRAAIEAGSKQAFVGSMERVAASEAARTIVAEQGTQVLLGATTRRQATQAALDAFARKGITGFIDKSGRGWNLESYVETAMRTGCGKAAVQGHVDRLVENGLDLVIVSDAPRECPLCRPWEGKVLSIGGVPVEMPEGTDPAFKVAEETPSAIGTPPGEYPDEMGKALSESDALRKQARELEAAARGTTPSGIMPSTMEAGDWQSNEAQVLIDRAESRMAGGRAADERWMDDAFEMSSGKPGHLDALALSEQGVKARTAYVGDDVGCLRMNAALRAGGAPTAKVRSIDAAIEEATLAHDVTLYRTSLLPDSLVESITPGGRWANAGFQSCDLTEDTARFYADSRAEDGIEGLKVLFKMSVPKGGHVGNFGYGEVVLPRNTAMHIRSVARSGEYTIVDVEVR